MLCKTPMSLQSHASVLPKDRTSTHALFSIAWRTTFIICFIPTSSITSKSVTFICSSLITSVQKTPEPRLTWRLLEYHHVYSSLTTDALTSPECTDCSSAPDTTGRFVPKLIESPCTKVCLRLFTRTQVQISNKKAACIGRSAEQTAVQLFEAHAVFHLEVVLLIFHFCLFLIRLTPSNCPAVGDGGLYETYPWFEMMVKIQSITGDLKSKFLSLSNSLVKGKPDIMRHYHTIRSSIGIIYVLPVLESVKKKHSDLSSRFT